MNIISLYIIISFLLLYTFTNFGQTAAQISISFEVYDNAGGQETLYFGLDQTATDGIDFHLGESDLPPYPPIGAFDARWLLPQNGFNGSLSSWSDYRFASGFPFSGTIEHRFRFQSMAGANAMFVGWNLPQTITGLIQDLANGAIINVPISGSGTYQITDYQNIDKLKLFVYYNNIVSTVESDLEFHSDYVLEQNYPNPFNPITKIRYSIPSVEDQPQSVQIGVYDLLGNEIVMLIDEIKTAGTYEVEFNGANLPSGIYFCQMRSGNFIETIKLLMLK